MGKSSTSVRAQTMKDKKKDKGNLGFDDFMNKGDDEFVNIHTIEEGNSKYFKTDDDIKRNKEIELYFSNRAQKHE